MVDPSGKLQDCLGMTPLHILACSTVQDIGLYQVLVKMYPENLIIEDEWGALPLLYALWGNAPPEVVQFMVESYQFIYPGYEFNWTMMVETLGKASSLEVVQNLLDVQRGSFPEQSIDWDQVLANLARGGKRHEPCATDDVFKFLIKYSISTRLGAIGLKIWREDVTYTIENMPLRMKKDGKGNAPSRSAPLNEIQSKLARYEVEYHKLKEATSMLELVMWKLKINESMLDLRLWKSKINESNSIKTEGRESKKLKVDAAFARSQCRVNCGADIIIENVLPYLLRY